MDCYKLDDIIKNSTDLNGTKPITNPLNLDEINKQAQNVENSISSLRKASKETFTTLKSDVSTQIAVLNRLVKAFQNAEYSATSLFAKNIDVLKSVYSNKLNEYTAKISGTGAFSIVKDDLKNLKTLLYGADNSDSFKNFYNQFDVLKSKVQSLNEEIRQSNKLTDSLNADITKLSNLNNAAIFRKNSDNSNVQNLNSKIGEILAKYNQLKTAAESDKSSENIAKCNTQFNELHEQL